MPGTQPVPGLHGGCDSPDFDELDLGATSVTSTARDLAVFQQMLLNGGDYDGRRILSGASVTAMTRSQVGKDIPALVTLINPTTGQKVEFEIKGSDYGYGQYLFGVGDRFAANGSLFSLSAIGHMGYTGAYVWSDPEHELIGIFLAVAPRLKRGFPERNSDLFMNAVYAAIVE
jgi:CubicO group peptidase (beta-lactamase class C family)